MKKILVSKIAKENGLELLAGEAGLNATVSIDEISRPGLEFTGFFKYFDPSRLVLIGSKDAAFLDTLDKETILKNVEEIFKKKPPIIVFSKNVIINPIFLEMAEKYGVAVFKSTLRTTQTSSKLYTYLQDNLAERISVHGTLMDINGMGTLIIGKSGIGKSETALDLIKRGHQLIADDLVEVFEHEPGNLLGEAPEVLKRYIEIRGIGIVDVVAMFGAAAYRPRKSVKVVIELETWDDKKNYDRLGLENYTSKYFNTEIPRKVIPVLPGRNVALLVESAAMNEKLKLLGHDTSMEFIDKIDAHASRKGDLEDE